MRDYGRRARLGVLLLAGLVAWTSASFRNHVKPPDEIHNGCPSDLLHTHAFKNFAHACRQQPALAVVAFEGVADAMQECRERMRFQAWDCSQPGTVLHEPSLLRYGYRESAYLLALSAAGAAWGVATACAQGWLPECRCEPAKAAAALAGGGGGALAEGARLDALLAADPDWRWGGCSYGVQFGVEASRRLLSRTGGQLRAPLRRLEKHNLKAGRMAVKKTLIQQCKCHGVSGSCQHKTCWKKTADLTRIADFLTDRYYRAKLLAAEGAKPKSTDLVYLEQSPETCTPYTYEVKQRRSLPRICNWRNETHSMGDCNVLCCGRGFTIRHEPTTYKCDCKIVGCCTLQCAECLQHQWVSTCNN